MASPPPSCPSPPRTAQTIDRRCAAGRPPWVLLAAALALVACPLFRRKHVRVASVPELPYPSCGDRPLPPGEVIAAGHLRSGPEMLERHVVERFEVRRRDCLHVATVHQEWPLAITDLEVVYDADLLPLRVWKRGTIPGVRRADGHADTRRYELRTPEVTIKRRTPEGETLHEILRGGRPQAVLGPGRGLLTMWFRRARLGVGQRRRELVLDVRAELETIQPVTLRREPDRYEPSLGRTVRVYTVLGRESVFADENDVVVGDLAGLRPHHTLRTPPPAPLPTYGPPDPVHTP